MEEKQQHQVRPIIFWVIGIGVLAFVILILSIIFNAIPSEAISNSISNSDNQTILIESSTVLSPVGRGITSSTVKANNDTWLDFNNTNEDFVLVNSNIIDSITFWYKNETSEWIFVANSSGTNYVDSVIGSPNQFPVFYNGTGYFLGKTDGTTFFNGSIDDFRVYESTLQADLIILIYQDGRL